MGKRHVLTALVLFPMVSGAWASADEVRYYEQNGVTYRETRKVVQRPVTETRVERRDQTVYREQYHTEVNEQVRSVYTPVTEYQWVPVMKGRWNPLTQPYYAHELMPVRRWESRQEVVRTPTYRRELIPEVRTVEVPVTTQRMAQEEVITRVAVSGAVPSAANVASQPAPSTNLGGVARLENDPPRRSTNTWSAAGGATRY